MKATAKRKAAATDAINMDYGLREPTYEEIRKAFGSITNAYSKTGGSPRLILFLLNNPQRIEACAPDANHAGGGFADKLRDAAVTERVAGLWNEQAKANREKRPVVSAIMRATGYGRARVRDYLKRAGIDPSVKGWHGCRP